MVQGGRPHQQRPAGGSRESRSITSALQTHQHNHTKTIRIVMLLLTHLKVEGNRFASNVSKVLEIPRFVFSLFHAWNSAGVITGDQYWCVHKAYHNIMSIYLKINITRVKSTASALNLIKIRFCA